LTSSSLGIGVDVGGSSIKCALIDLQSGQFAGERFSTPTPAQGSTEALLDALASVVAKIPGDHAVGLAFPSVIRAGTVRTAANLNKAWIGQPLAQLAAKRLARPVIAINDADAAGLAEAMHELAALISEATNRLAGYKSAFESEPLGRLPATEPSIDLGELAAA